MTKPTAEQLVELQRLSNPELTEVELFAMLAESAGLGADEIDRAGEGRVLFSRIWKRCGGAICANPIVKAYVSNPTASDSTTIAAQVLNLLAQVDGVNVVVVAALALRIGLRTLCANLTVPGANPQGGGASGGAPPS